MSIITEALLKQSEKLAATAKNGTLKIDGEVYTLIFNHREWVYSVTDSSGDTVARFNTKTLANAKRMLKQWFAN